MLVAIFMMNNLTFGKWTAKYLLSYNAMVMPFFVFSVGCRLGWELRKPQTM